MKLSNTKKNKRLLDENTGRGSLWPWPWFRIPYLYVFQL